MNPFEEIMRGASRGGVKGSAISGNEREAIREKFVHIVDLKEGDKVQWKRGMRDSVIPLMDETVEVFRVFPTRYRAVKGSSHDCDEIDFSVIYRDNDSDIVEYAFDSRRFERVD